MPDTRPSPDIERWVEESPGQLPFRQAVHTLLHAIAETPALRAHMVMKGGILLGLGYGSSRYTTDVDFSTDTKPRAFDQAAFGHELAAGLIHSVETLGYGLDCRIQSCRMQPPQEDATFPTLQIKIGYAAKGSNEHRRLLKRQAPHVVQVDYSLNEPLGEPDEFVIEQGGTLLVYSLQDLIAEKLRALLQQAVRHRNRRQDIYDLYFILETHPQLRDDADTQRRILASLQEKARARDLPVTPQAMREPEIRRRSQAEYESLRQEIEGELPPFDEAYGNVQGFFEHLPWATSR